MVPASRRTGHPFAASSSEELSQKIELELLERELSRTEKALRAEREKLEPKMTLEDAFDFDPSEYLADVVKGTLAVSYLLDSLSQIGKFNSRHFARIIPAAVPG
jgi:hypothetical protein